MKGDDSSRADPANARLAAWVQTHGQALFDFVMVQLRDRHQAEDVVQEVFCRAWQARDRYIDQGQERAYLWRIADRLACDRLRRLARRHTVTMSDESDAEPRDDSIAAPPATLEQQESKERLAAALDELSEGQRRTLLLRYYSQLEFHEIAELLELPLNTVLSHARRGLMALRKRFTD